MWSEKRGIEDFIFFAVFPILINITTNLVYFLSNDPHSMLQIINDFNGFTIFGVVVSCIFNFFIKQKELSKDEKDKLNKKMFGMKLLSVAFIGYMIFSVVVVRNTSISISSLIMFISYINWYILKVKSKAIAEVGLSETQKNWREFHNIPTYQENTLLWKIKPMIFPHVSVSLSERVKHINWFVLIFILIFFKFFTTFTLEILPMMIIIFILIFSEILYFIDVLMGLYSETEGKCTGIILKERRINGERKIYYEVYVTDVVNKRELKFKVYKYCNYNEGDSIKLIHGGLSKKVIKVNYDNPYKFFREDF